VVVSLAVGFRYLSGAAATVTIGGGIGPELAAVPWIVAVSDLLYRRGPA
jgi:hypothetical protein